MQFRPSEGAMASHPYISGPGNVSAMITQLRKSFPGTVTSETVKKLGLAPNNESYVINALQFLGIVDADGKRTADAAKIFVAGDDDFKKGFEKLVRASYKDLFDLHQNGAWDLDKA